MGATVEEKGFDTAIAAARAARVPLLIAGDGPDLERLKRLAGDGEVQFAGRLDARALSQALADAAALLAPSRWEEPCPYSVLDALAAGVPVLVSDRGGLSEIAGGESSLPAEDQSAWNDAVAQLWRDADGRGERGERALARARERFGENRYYERLIGVYGG